MLNVVRLSAFLLFLLPAGSLVAQPQGPSSPYEAEIRERPATAGSGRQVVTIPDTLDAFILRQMEERRIPGLVVAVARNGTLLRAGAYGVADVQNGSPVDTDTRFELASITKQFTAAGIMLLVQEDKLDLDASIATYLPDVPEAWRSITPRHLLNHTSGLPSLASGFSGWDVIPLNITTEQAYRAARADTLQFVPGACYTYSDVGYFLLGVITERASGMPWREFIEERIFAPVGMTQSYILDQGAIHRNEARNYTIRDGELQNARRVRQSETPSHYGIFSNVHDLVTWDAALYTEDLLTEASMAEMWAPAQLSSGTTFPYGFGWQVWSQHGHRVQRHTGITGTEIVRLPDDTLSVIVLTNLGGGGPDIHSWGIALRIAEKLRPALTHAEGGTAPLSEDERRAFVGEYEACGGQRARVVMEEGRLRFGPAAAPRTVPLAYRGGLTFELPTRDRWLVFERDGAGRINGLTLFSAGGASVIKFVPEEQ